MTEPVKVELELTPQEAFFLHMVLGPIRDRIQAGPATDAERQANQVEFLNRVMVKLWDAFLGEREEPGESL